MNIDEGNLKSYLSKLVSQKNSACKLTEENTFLALANALYGDLLFIVYVATDSIILLFGSEKTKACPIWNEMSDLCWYIILLSLKNQLTNTIAWFRLCGLVDLKIR